MSGFWLEMSGALARPDISFCLKNQHVSGKMSEMSGLLL
jgi:hypothetical protein